MIIVMEQVGSNGGRVMKEEIVAAKDQLRAAINVPMKYIAVDVDNASSEDNAVIEQLVEELNTQRELSYYLPIYEAAKNFVEAFAESYELDKEL